MPKKLHGTGELGLKYYITQPQKERRKQAARRSKGRGERRTGAKRGWGGGRSQFGWSAWQHSEGWHWGFKLELVRTGSAHHVQEFFLKIYLFIHE